MVLVPRKDQFIEFLGQNVDLEGGGQAGMRDETGKPVGYTPKEAQTGQEAPAACASRAAPRIRQELRQKAMQRLLVGSRGRSRGGRARPGTVMAHRVTQPEAQPAHERQSEKDPEQRPRAERHLGVAPVFFSYRFPVV